MTPYPPSLFKYRAFNVRTLRLVAEAEAYYSDPSTFNDPLDCDPTIDVNLEQPELIQLFTQLRMEVLQVEGIVGDRARNDVRQTLDHLSYMSTDPDSEISPDQYLSQLLGQAIENDLKKKMKTVGVLSFSARWDSVLMWSHYADEHRGICIEYDTQMLPHKSLWPINYGGARAIRASELHRWLVAQDSEAGQAVFNIYFLSKALDWKYEQEWRDISGNAGATVTSYTVRSITFGLRCDPAVKKAIILMHSPSDKVEFYDVYLLKNEFSLQRYVIDDSEDRAFGIRKSPFLAFKDVSLPKKVEK